MIDTRLRDADPAALLVADVRSIEARTMLADILAEPRPAPRRPSRPVRRVVVGGGLAAAAAIATFVGLGGSGGTRLSADAYAVSSDRNGTVRVELRQWSEVSKHDAAQLQDILDQRGARIKLFVIHGSEPLCPPSNTIGYPAGAVDWDPPSSASVEDEIVLHPDRFPAGATFVVVVELAAPGSGMSTGGPAAPAINGTLSYMVRGPVSAPTC